MARKKSGLYDELTKRIPATELSTLLKVSSSLASTMELAEVLQIAIESVTDLLNIGTGAIYTLDHETLTIGATTPDEAREVIDLSWDFIEKRQPNTRLQYSRSKAIFDKHWKL